MKKTALMLALMTLAGTALAGGCHTSYDDCQQHPFMFTARGNQPSGATQNTTTQASDAWLRINQSPASARSGH
jgi:hypothetical protein